MVSSGSLAGIVLDARLEGSGGGAARFTSRLRTPDGWQVLEWTLYSLHQAGVREPVLLCTADSDVEVPGGQRIRRVELDGRGLVEELVELLQRPAAGVFLTYSNALFRPHICSQLAAMDGDVVLAVDTAWRRRYEQSNQLQRMRAEKVSLDGTRVRQIGCLLDDARCDAEFTGLAYLSRQGIEALRDTWLRVRSECRDRPFHDALTLADASVTDLIQELIQGGTRVVAADVSRDWADIKEIADLSRFVYGTKAETLERLKSVVLDTQIADLIHFEVGRWVEDRQALVELIGHRFQNQRIVVRSSSLVEDSWTESLAGEFQSVLGVDAGDPGAIAAAVDRVIDSYRQSEKTNGHALHRHQVLVQAFLEAVTLSGVLFTRDLGTGAPYFVLNYDDQTGSTDSVTGGGGQNLKTLVLNKHSDAELDRPELGNVVRAARELERITGCDSLDIEFATTADGKVHLFQVRPLATARKWPSLDPHAFAAMIGRAREFLAGRMRPANPRTILSNMTDWNPAEMISTAPSPLAASLYEYLVTDSTWRRARAAIGYHGVPGHRLMVSVCGRPYIDVRNSFRSFVPAAIPEELRERLVDSWLTRLERHPELHDKAEFDIVPTCMAFDFERHAALLADDGFTSAEIASLKRALLTLTDDIVAERPRSIADAMAAVDTLAARADAAVAAGPTLRAIAALLVDCRENGVLPFSILARYAFIGTSLLRSLVAADVLSREQADAITRGVHTVATDMVADLLRTQKGEIAVEAFLRRYGHLRPGTYDITSRRYDEAPELYLGLSEEGCQPAHAAAPFELSGTQREQVRKLLQVWGFTVTPEQLMAFITNAIRGREDAKFAFSRNVSEALRLLCDLGEQYGLERADMAYANIHDLLRWADRSEGDEVERLLRVRIAEAQECFPITAAVHLPDVIRHADDLDVIHQFRAQPNFVTQKRVTAQTVCLDDGLQTDLSGKIVLIESADPGFDWVFSRKVAGLITMFGGANSHMAIRCAEFSIPAAIGCGSVLYEAARVARTVELDCAGRTLRVGV